MAKSLGSYGYVRHAIYTYIVDDKRWSHRAKLRRIDGYHVKNGHLIRINGSDYRIYGADERFIYLKSHKIAYEPLIRMERAGFQRIMEKCPYCQAGSTVDPLPLTVPPPEDMLPADWDGGAAQAAEPENPPTLQMNLHLDAIGYEMHFLVNGEQYAMRCRDLDREPMGIEEWIDVIATRADIILRESLEEAHKQLFSEQSAALEAEDTDDDV